VSAPEPVRRLFFALWPGDDLRAALAPRLRDLQPQGHGRPQSPDQWHVTLEFLGTVPEARLAAVREAAEAVRAAPFELVFDAVEHWRRPAVLCLVARGLPPALEALVAQLRAGLATRGFEPEQRPFRAHLTLARKVTRPGPVGPCEGLHWPAQDFVLVESVTERTGSRYRPLDRWPLLA
jgi:2'-5' RNA ligase